MKKKKRYSTEQIVAALKQAEMDLTRNEAFPLSDKVTRQTYEEAYLKSHVLYYRTPVAFEDITVRFGQNLAHP